MEVARRDRACRQSANPFVPRVDAISENVEQRLCVAEIGDGVLVARGKAAVVMLLHCTEDCNNRRDSFVHSPPACGFEWLRAHPQRELQIPMSDVAIPPVPRELALFDSRVCELADLLSDHSSTSDGSRRIESVCLF